MAKKNAIGIKAKKPVKKKKPGAKAHAKKVKASKAKKKAAKTPPVEVTVEPTVNETVLSTEPTPIEHEDNFEGPGDDIVGEVDVDAKTADEFDNDDSDEGYF